MFVVAAADGAADDGTTLSVSGIDEFEGAVSRGTDGVVGVEVLGGGVVGGGVDGLGFVVGGFVIDMTAPAVLSR